MVGVDDDLVDELHQLVVALPRRCRRVALAVVAILGAQALEQVADVAEVGCGAEERVERVLELLRVVTQYLIRALREDVVDDPATP